MKFRIACLKKFSNVWVCVRKVCFWMKPVERRKRIYESLFVECFYCNASSDTNVSGLLCSEYVAAVQPCEIYKCIALHVYPVAIVFNKIPPYNLSFYVCVCVFVWIWILLSISSPLKSQPQVEIHNFAFHMKSLEWPTFRWHTLYFLSVFLQHPEPHLLHWLSARWRKPTCRLHFVSEHSSRGHLIIPHRMVFQLK